MKIIEKGLEPTPPTWRLRCPTCKTLFEYTEDDIRHFGHLSDFSFVAEDNLACPNCRAYLAHSLGWRVDPIGRADAGAAEQYYNK